MTDRGMSLGEAEQFISSRRIIMITVTEQLEAIRIAAKTADKTELMYLIEDIDDIIELIKIRSKLAYDEQVMTMLDEIYSREE